MIQQYRPKDVLFYNHNQTKLMQVFDQTQCRNSSDLKRAIINISYNRHAPTTYVLLNNYSEPLIMSDRLKCSFVATTFY